MSPQNVLVGIDGVPRLVDFGVAKAAGRVGQETREGQLKGKLAYMAPEQIRGATDRRTDIYAASVVLWEALTGKRLFAGQTDIEVFSKVAEGTKTPPSTYVPGLPAILDAVTLRGLDRDPDRRYQTAREMARALEEALPLVAASKISASGSRTPRRRSCSTAQGGWSRFESSSAMRAPVVADLGSGRLPAPAATSDSGQLPDATSAIIDVAQSTQLSAVSAPSAIAHGPHKTSRRMRMAAIGFGVSLAALVAVFGVLQLRSGVAQSSRQTAPDFVSSTPPAVQQPVASAPAAPSLPAPVAPSTASTASSAGSPGSAPTASPPPTARSGVAPAMPVAPARAANNIAAAAKVPPAAVPPRGASTVAPPPPAAVVPSPKAPVKDDAYDHM